MISARYSVVVAIFLGIAMVPAIIHSYLGATSKDGHQVKLLSEELAGVSFISTNRYDSWAEGAFGAFDWIERRSKTTDASQFRLFVGRSYDHKRLYHHPELAILYGTDLENAGVRLSQSMDDVPIHFLTGRGTKKGVAAYCILYDREFVENPILFQFLISFKLLFSLGKPMTLFFVYDQGAKSVDGFEETTAGQILKAAVDDFRSQVNL